MEVNIRLNSLDSIEDRVLQQKLNQIPIPFIPNPLSNRNNICSEKIFINQTILLRILLVGIGLSKLNKFDILIFQE